MNINSHVNLHCETSYNFKCETREVGEILYEISFEILHVKFSHVKLYRFSHLRIQK